MSHPKQNKKLSRRSFIKGSAGTGLGVLAGAALLSETAKATHEILPPLTREEYLTTGDFEGLLNVAVHDGDILRVTSLDAPNLEASPMALNWHRRAFAPDRILYPMKRVDWQPGGQGNGANRGQPRYVRISWDEALDLVASELKRVKTTYGNEAILAQNIAGWESAGNFNTKNGHIGRFIGMFGGGTQILGNKSYACWQWAAPYSIGMIFTSMTHKEALENSKLIIHWGGDPMKTTRTWVGLGQNQKFFKNAKAKGIKQIVIDPLYNWTSEVADEHISIRPGADCAMMAAVAHVMITEDLYDKDFIKNYTVGFDPFKAYVMGETDGTPKTPEWAEAITDIPADKIRSFAREFATTERVLIIPGLGMQRVDHGEQPVRMIIALAAMKGELGLPGAGLAHFVYGIFGLPASIGKGPAGFPGVPNPVTQTILEQHFADLVLNPGQTINHDGKSLTYPQPGKSELKLIYWAGGSSLNQHDNINKTIEALRKMETFIVQDAWWTPAARMADIVLPANTVWEREDMIYMWRYAVYQHKLIESLGESRPDFDIFADLALRLGFHDEYTEGLSAEQWLRRLYAESNIPLTYDEFKAQGFHKFDTVDYPNSFSQFRQDQFANPLSTPSGLVEIHSETIANYGYADCPGTPQFMEPFEWLGSEKAKTYPLHLITMHPRWRRHSSYDNVDTLHENSKINGFEPVFINPEDAAERGIQTGDVVRVFNDRGQILAGAFVTDTLRKKVVIVQEGSWYSPTEPGTIGSLDRGGCANNLTIQRGTSQLAQGPVAHTGLAQVEKFVGEAKPNDFAPIEPVNK